MNNTRLFFLIYRVIYAITTLIFLVMTLLDFWQNIVGIYRSYRNTNEKVRSHIKKHGKTILCYFAPRILKRAWGLLLIILLELIVWGLLSFGVLRPLG